MRLYLDTSALVKLVVAERESSALEHYLSDRMADTHFTAALSRTELVRAVTRLGSVESVQHARRLLSRLDVVALTSRLLDAAAVIPPLGVRTLGAIHLAAAMTAPDLRAVVTYDERLANAAATQGVTVATPR